MSTQRHEEKSAQRERERESPFPLAPLFICLFLPLGLPYANWTSQERCLFYLRTSLHPGTFLHCIYAGFSLPCLLAAAILDSCFLIYLPNMTASISLIFAKYYSQSFFHMFYGIFFNLFIFN